ncbi:universal stress protein, partial [Bordetella hinzii]|nr:universal stress protein [Bordetella hinzii]
ILRTAIGSVAEKLLEALPCDVLIVRQAKAAE